MLSNHFHFAIKIKEIEDLPEKYATERHLSRAFSNCFNAYAQAINKGYGRTGSLFEETYNRKEVDREPCFKRLIVYIHANPEHHRFCEDFHEYLHSSFLNFNWILIPNWSGMKYGMSLEEELGCLLNVLIIRSTCDGYRMMQRWKECNPED